MKRRVAYSLLGIGVLGLLGFLLAASGVVSIKASSGHWAVTQWFLEFARKRSVATHSVTIKVPENLHDPGLVLKGAGHYEIGCRSCHGEPGRAPPRIVSGMSPKPPELAERIRASNPRALFYIVKHGVKMTGMPAWPSPHRDDEVWAMVAFLQAFPSLNPESYRRLVQPPPAEVAQATETTRGAHPVPPAVRTCVGCHGSDGLGRDTDVFPKLAAQPVEYLRTALEAYAAGRRHSGTMEPVAHALGPEARNAVAEYFARLPSPPVPSRRAESEREAAAIVRGEAIARFGLPDQRVPACMECHGPDGPKRKPEYPLLAGQPAAYLQLQLGLFRENRRGGAAHAHLMQPITERLTPAQIQDVTLFFQSLGKSSEGGRRVLP